MRHNHRVMDGTFLLQEAEYRPNVRLDKQDAVIELIVMLVVLGIVTTACLVIWWPS